MSMDDNITPIRPDEVQVDETRQRGTEHNAKAFGKRLHEAGFSPVVMRPLSEFTIALHTRSLSASERSAFREWVSGQPSIEFIREDHVGGVYLVQI